MKKKLLLGMISLAIFMGTASLSLAKQVLQSAPLTTGSVVSGLQKYGSLYAAKPEDPCVPLSCKPPLE